MSINMQNQSIGRKRPYIRKLLLNLIAMLALFVASTLGVVAVMHNYTQQLIETSQQELLPAIHDHQRAALNLERLERMGDLVVYGGSVSLIRKNALAAQVLAYQPSFNFNSETKQTVQAAFELLREVRRTRQTLLSSQADRLSSLERENLRQLERTLQIRWAEYKQDLFELQNRIISDATTLQTQNMSQITATNNLMLVVASCGISLLLLIVFFIGYNLYKHLITPVTEASTALMALEKQEGHQPLASARYQELHTIHNAVNNLGDTMKKLHTMATRDSLTGCVNRGYFMELAQEALTSAHRNRTPLALAMLDVDHFKKVNDTYGHLAGDFVLKEVTRLCKKILRNDDVIGRYGGEEFAILIYDLSTNETERIIERMGKIIREHKFYISKDQYIHITVSFGIYRPDLEVDTDIHTITNNADKGLYKAKNKGRDCLVIHKEHLG